ncbi:anti-sigma-D factor RsdA [Rhodococcus sp. NPDC057529]|uniref:anti-sigma-D factor RsdA n=1 Tax=Rhodococcus sp. NPDC057529 TaxID=3346158 RepID=UPI00366AB01F
MRGVARDIERNGNPDADLPEDDAPVDVAAVRRDDALIDAIAGGESVATDSPEQDQLALLLTSWRADIVSTPMPSGPLLDDVIAAIDASDARSARSAARGKLRLLRPIAGAAAAIAVVMGGVTILSYDAAPGDPLWSVKSVVFSQQADSTVAQIDTTSQLQEAERLIAAGDTESARNLLEGAADRSGEVRDADTRNELEVWRAKLAAELEKIAPTTPPATTTPGTTTPAPTQTTPLPATVQGTPGTTTVPGVGQLPGTLPTDLLPPGLPPTSVTPLPTLPPQLPLPPETLPSTSPEPPITVVPPPEPPLPVPSDDPTTQPPIQQPPPEPSTAPLPPPAPPDNPTTQPPPPAPSDNPTTQPPIQQPPPPEPSTAPLPSEPFPTS